ncbi:hypothetical protein [Paraburkholderia sp. BL10I2N1]|uniref:hypothetical protein n=1 Tax=Paraburkholderia sp. BL10I2N1 TaxID=1938796 RepID=UPI00105B6188|nr:hypothetical protein [Paraburkholderia sp. BL10I2N1]TDN68791.1 hypothetical protein B0G77_2138 [Paraburkholderia sp. BL10I2N1]
MDADKYKYRYRAVIEYANGAMFNVGELDTWATSTKIPISFSKLFAVADPGDDYDAAHHFISYEILSDTISRNVVPDDTDPEDARTQLGAAHDFAAPTNPVQRLRDLVMVRYDRQLLCGVYDGELHLYDTLTLMRMDVTAGRLRYEARALSALAHPDAISESTLWARRQPAPLFAGAGFSPELLKRTTLTKYLEFDTWTPAAAAMLICGIQAPIVEGQLCTEISEKGAMGLDNCFLSGSQDPFHEARRVLGIWRSQVNPPTKIRPLDFVRWCQARGLDVGWLRSLEEQASNRERDDMKAAMGSGVVVVPSTPLVSCDWLADHIAFTFVSIPDDERLTTVFKVTVLKQIPVLTQSKREPLTGADWQIVRSICGNPPTRCSRAQFAEWREVFDQAPNRPAWSLGGDFCGSAEMQKAQARWCDVSTAHKAQIAQNVTDGELALVTAEGITTVDTAAGFIRRDDIKRYLDRYHLRWQDSHGTARNAVGVASISGGSEFVGHEIVPDARELSTIGLTPGDWALMSSSQCQSASRAIADTAALAEQGARQAEERRALGRYTLNDAGKAIAATGERFEALIEKISSAARRGDLPMHAPGERARYEYLDDKPVRPFYEEAYWNDLNTWPENHEPRITFRFDAPHVEANASAATPQFANAAQPVTEACAPVRNNSTLPQQADRAEPTTAPSRATRHTLTTRGDLLTPVIKAVVTKTGSYDTNVIFTPLREVAIEEDGPFNGVDDDGALLWTDAKGSKQRLTKKALAERLRNMKKRDMAGLNSAVQDKAG